MTKSANTPEYRSVKVTLAYEPSADRMTIHSLTEANGRISFEMTARFLSKLVGHLFAHPQLASLHEQWEKHPTAVKTIGEPVPPESAAVSPQSGQTTEFLKSASSAHTKNITAQQYALVNSCDVTVAQNKGVRLKFDISDRADPCYLILDLESIALLDFLHALWRQFKIAGWAMTAWHGSFEEWCVSNNTATIH